MSREVRGSVAFVTGASRGIGKAIALDLAACGCDVALVARTTSGLEDTADACRAYGVRVSVIPADLLEAASLEAAIERCVSELGGLDILVNNAGVFEPGTALDADPDGWDRMLSVNLNAAMRATNRALPHLIKGGRGCVIFISSLAGRFTAGGMSAYCASKHGLMGFAGCLFDEVRDQGVKVSAICPGWTNTEMMSGSGIDAAGVIQPQDIAAAVRYVVTSSENACPGEIQIHPQRSPRRVS